MCNSLIDIVKDIKEGNKNSVSLFYNKYYSVIKNRCKRIVCLDYIAEELANDVILKFTKYIESFNNIDSEISIKSYLYYTIRSVCFTYLSKNKKYKSTLSLDDENNHFVETSVSDLHVDISTIVQNCENDNNKNVFIEYAINGKSHKQIAEDLSMNLQTVKVKYSRFKKKVQQKIYEESY